MVAAGSIILLAVLVGLSGIFSGSETALVASSRFKLRMYVQQKRFGATYLQKLKENPHRMITTLLISSNAVNIAAASIATKIALGIFDSNAVAYATGIMTFIILVFGEIVPKSYATTYADSIALVAAPGVYVLNIILAPLVLIFDFITVHIFRVKPSVEKITEEEIRNIIDIAKEEGGIDKEEKEFIHKIFKFDDIDVDAIKIPRTDMVALDVKSTLKDAIAVIKRKQHSRYPVFEGTLDNIVGVFYYKDAISHIQKKNFEISIKRLMRSPLVVPETKKLDETLKFFQRKKQHMAIIVDEHGGVSGLVTIEDVLEEIVGEIVDETDKVEPEINKINRNTYKVLGKTDIDSVNKKLKTKFKVKDEYDTMSGYILHELGRIPKVGEEIFLQKAKFKIKKVKENRILEVEIRK